jgi:hypothetical protein
VLGIRIEKEYYRGKVHKNYEKQWRGGIADFLGINNETTKTSWSLK